MRIPPVCAALFASCACCAAPETVVTAPLVPSVLADRSEASAAVSSASLVTPGACSQKWTLDGVAGGPGRVVVVCGSDVRREALDESGPMARAIVPALEPARERVCACAGRIASPAFVDLVITAILDDGRVTAEASKPDDALDPDVDPAFAACVGTVVASFAPSRPGGCASLGKMTVVYPVRIDLTP